MAETNSKKYLDQAGLQQVWTHAENLFANKNATDTALSGKIGYSVLVDKTIYFYKDEATYNTDKAVEKPTYSNSLASIDASPFYTDGMLESVTVTKAEQQMVLPDGTQEGTTVNVGDTILEFIWTGVVDASGNPKKTYLPASAIGKIYTGGTGISIANNNTISVHNVPGSQVMLGADVSINQGPLATAFATVYTKGIPANLTFEQFIKDMAIKESWPTSGTYNWTETPTKTKYAAPSFSGIDWNEKVYFVGTLLPLPTISTTKPTVTAGSFAMNGWAVNGVDVNVVGKNQDGTATAVISRGDMNSTITTSAPSGGYIASLKWGETEMKNHWKINLTEDYTKHTCAVSYTSGMLNGAGSALSGTSKPGTASAAPSFGPTDLYNNTTDTDLAGKFKVKVGENKITANNNGSCGTSTFGSSTYNAKTSNLYQFAPCSNVGNPKKVTENDVETVTGYVGVLGSNATVVDGVYTLNSQILNASNNVVTNGVSASKYCTGHYPIFTNILTSSASAGTDKNITPVAVQKYFSKEEIVGLGALTAADANDALTNQGTANYNRNYYVLNPTAHINAAKTITYGTTTTDTEFAKLYSGNSRQENKYLFFAFPTSKTPTVYSYNPSSGKYDSNQNVKVVTPKTEAGKDALTYNGVSYSYFVLPSENGSSNNFAPTSFRISFNSAMNA